MSAALSVLDIETGLEMCSERVVVIDSHVIKIDHTLHWVKLNQTSEAEYYHNLSMYHFGVIALLDDSITNKVVQVPASPSSTTSSPTPFISPVITPSPTAKVSVPIMIASARIGRNMAGVPEINVVFRNNSKFSLDRIDFVVRCYDAYGDIIKGYDRYSETLCYYQEGILYPGKATPTNHQWTLYGFDGAKKIEIAIVKYHFTTGETVIVPEDQWKWHTFR